MKSLRTSNGLLRVALAATLVGGHATALAHFLLVPHGLCPEHGEFVHEASVHGGHLGADGPGDRARSSLVAEFQPGNAHGHDHCSLAASRRHNPALASAGESRNPDAHDSVRAVERASTPAQTLDLLRVAPKQSPPFG